MSDEETEKEPRYPDASTDCRMIGPGGTTVNFYATPEGVKCVWVNENCPYDWGSALPITEDTQEAADGHNVSLIPWDEIQYLLNRRPK